MTLRFVIVAGFFSSTVFTYFLGLLIYFILVSPKAQQDLWIPKCAIEKDHTWTTQWSMRDRTKSVRWGWPQSKVMEVLIPIFRVLLPFSWGHKLGCPLDVFPLVHTNILKLSSNLPTFKMGKYCVKTQMCWFFCIDNTEPVCQWDNNG